MEAVYIHIPFCASICTYCDFYKVIKNEKWIDKYLYALAKEIKENYNGELIKTLYIGGGTPSCLNLKQLNRLFEIIKIFNLTKDCEITFESNVEDLTDENLEFLKDKINRLSVGVQTFDENLIKILGRKTPNIYNLKLALKYFKNINVDLMYNFNEENLDILKKDIDMLVNLNIPHISAYSLILEKHTKLYIDGYKIKNDDVQNEKYISHTLKTNGYNHYEISNYAKKGFESKHNLTYWNNEHYYGFGLAASGYIDNIRYQNNTNLQGYLKGNFLKEKHVLDKNETIQNEFILGLRKIKGINKNKFKEKYNINIKDIMIVNDLLIKGLLKEDKDNIFINPKYLYLSNEILVNFIDINLL